MGLGPIQPVASPRNPEAEKIVVRRKRIGTITLDNLAREQRENFPAASFGGLPVSALYWYDRKRNLAEVIRPDGDRWPAAARFRGVFQVPRETWLRRVRPMKISGERYDFQSRAPQVQAAAPWQGGRMIARLVFTALATALVVGGAMYWVIDSMLLKRQSAEPQALARWEDNELLRIKVAGQQRCRRCRRKPPEDPYKWHEWHFTEYGDGLSIGPLCQRCWQALTPAKRLPFYQGLWIANIHLVSDVHTYETWPAAQRPSLDRIRQWTLAEISDWSAIQGAVLESK